MHLGVKLLQRLLEQAGPGGTVTLGGAGLSTESGIPDYRGPSGARRRYAPMTYHAFVSDAAARHRYWARSYLGWPQIARARPNTGHRAVAALQGAGLLSAVITQNVDGLHQAAGSADVIELHGGLDRTVCLGCGDRASRRLLGDRLSAVNPGFRAASDEVRPDGDVELSEAELVGFQMLGCVRCGGMLKPDVVFFGENVPLERVRRCYELVEAAGAVLVLGSSLAVRSGLRFVRHAAQRGTPVAIVNQGPTRGDELAGVRVDAPLGELLADLAGW
ncbi:MAG: NAD-dependent protein deacetylase [Pseudonocardiales bacterium]|nr:MAG: NAD-dependent protein deacetylase [Pseudonocardiales bacterium]